MKKKLTNNRGITLIALVVTIIILLILAAVSLGSLFDANGLFGRANEAATLWNDAKEEEADILNQVLNEMDNYSKNEEKIRVGDLVGKPAKDIKQDAVDDFDNEITIPAGFIVVGDGVDEVEYNYSGDRRPNVQDGIVIEDREGNQFVWIPIGEIENKDKTKTKITLGRYTFDEESGQSFLQQDADDYKKTVSIITELYDGTEISCKELLEVPEGLDAITAKDLGESIRMAKKEGGYYLSRHQFKAGEGEDGKIVISQNDDIAWEHYYDSPANYIDLVRQMYKKDESIVTDIPSSYFFDTMLVFLQCFSGTLESGSSFNLGEFIRYREWTTEIQDSKKPAFDTSPWNISRGHSYGDTTISYRDPYNMTSGPVNGITFRVLLYMLDN